MCVSAGNSVGEIACRRWVRGDWVKRHVVGWLERRSWILPPRWGDRRRRWSLSSGCGWLEVLCVWRWELVTDCSSFVCEKVAKSSAVIEVVVGGGGGQRRELMFWRDYACLERLLILLWKCEDLAVWTSVEKDESKDWYLVRSDGSFDLRHFLSAALSLVRFSRRTSDNRAGLKEDRTNVV